MFYEDDRHSEQQVCRHEIGTGRDTVCIYFVLRDIAKMIHDINAFLGKIRDVYLHRHCMTHDIFVFL